MQEFPDTHLSLIARMKNWGDEAAWLEFVGIYQPVVFRLARWRGLQNADAHDVIQQVFLSVARSIDTWEPAENGPPFRAWLATIAKNAITKALVRRPADAATGGTSVMEVLQNQCDAEATATELLSETRRAIVRWAADQIRVEFSEQTWRAFELTAIQGIAIADVAQSTGKSAGSIYVARYRVLARLNEKVQEVSQLWDVWETPQ